MFKERVSFVERGEEKILMIEKIVREAFPDAEIRSEDLTGNPDHLHLGLLVASDAFLNRSRLSQHRMIMDVLKDQLSSNTIHAVKLKTMTLDQYNKQINE